MLVSYNQSHLCFYQITGADLLTVNICFIVCRHYALEREGERGRRGVREGRMERGGEGRREGETREERARERAREGDRGRRGVREGEEGERGRGRIGRAHV